MGIAAERASARSILVAATSRGVRIGDPRRGVARLARGWILGDALASVLHQDVSVAQMIAEGAERWAGYFLAYVIQSVRLPPVVWISVAAAVVGLAAYAVFGLARRRDLAWRSDSVLFAATGVALMLATAILQAPTLRSTPIALQVQDLPITVAGNSRFFYLSFIGLAMFAVGLFAIAKRSAAAPPNKLSGMALVVLVLICLIPWAWDSHALAREYRRDSLRQGALVHAATAAVAKLALPQQQCQVYLLDIPREQERFFMSTVDAAIKTLSADLAKVQACRFQIEATPWFHILARDTLTPDAAAPMQPLYLNQRRVAWPAYGRVEVAYLNLSADIDASSLTNAIFLAYQDGRFIDVSADVRDGRRSVKFRCARRPQQCIDAAAAAEISRMAQ